ncbi:MAG: alpha/beta hydrolase [Pseudoxanthomonas sp.]
MLLHGLWNARAWLLPLAWKLRAQGFEVSVFGYASILGGPEAAVDVLVRRLASGPSTHLVGHSLGGLVALEALRRHPRLPVPRLVCLGSPLCGSATARGLRRWSASGVVLGRSGALLHRGCEPWSGAAEVGMVAGSIPRGIGRVIGGLGRDSDGTVALAETRLQGLADHCLVPASHTGLVFSVDAARQAAHFLRRGRFAAAGAGTTASARQTG